MPPPLTERWTDGWTDWRMDEQMLDVRFCDKLCRPISLKKVLKLAFMCINTVVSVDKATLIEINLTMSPNIIGLILFRDAV